LNRRRRQAERRNIYNIDLHRLSSYPTYNRDKGNELSKGDIIRVVIGDMDGNGMGIASYKKFRVFVKGEVYPGDKVEVRVESIKGNSVIGKLERVEERRS